MHKLTHSSDGKADEVGTVDYIQLLIMHIEHNGEPEEHQHSEH